MEQRDELFSYCAAWLTVLQVTRLLNLKNVPAFAAGTLTEISNRPGIFKGEFLGRHVQLVKDSAESTRRRRGVFRLYCLSGHEVDR